jgi:hypothetical protein
VSDFVRYRIFAVEIDGPELPDGELAELRLYGRIEAGPAGRRFVTEDWGGPKPVDWKHSKTNASRSNDA